MRHSVSICQNGNLFHVLSYRCTLFQPSSPSAILPASLRPDSKWKNQNPTILRLIIMEQAMRNERVPKFYGCTWQWLESPSLVQSSCHRRVAFVWQQIVQTRWLWQHTACEKTFEHCVYQSSLWLLYEIKPLFYYSEGSVFGGVCPPHIWAVSKFIQHRSVHVVTWCYCKLCERGRFWVWTWRLWVTGY